MSHEQAIEENFRALTPPGFGSGKSWLVRTVEIMSATGSQCSMIVSGTPVHENFHAAYWKERETYAELLAAVATAGGKLSEFALINQAGRILGAGRIEPDDDADDIAWLSCMFFESTECSMAFDLPKGVDTSAIRNKRLGTLICSGEARA